MKRMWLCGVGRRTSNRCCHKVRLVCQALRGTLRTLLRRWTRPGKSLTMASKRAGLAPGDSAERASIFEVGYESSLRRGGRSAVYNSFGCAPVFLIHSVVVLRT